MGSRSPFSPGSPASPLARQVLRKFQSWRRKIPRGIRRIPEELWVAAIQLATSTSVYQVSRLLGLDYCQLKKRVIAVPAECPALPGRLNVETDSGTRRVTCYSSGSSHIMAPANGLGAQTSGRPPSSAGSVDPLRSGPPCVIPGVQSGAPSGDGFLEASLGTPQTWLALSLLAEIRGPAGYILRLFSPDTARIVQAFMHP
jgi:hypothetical protein